MLQAWASAGDLSWPDRSSVLAAAKFKFLSGKHFIGQAADESRLLPRACKCFALSGCSAARLQPIGGQRTETPWGSMLCAPGAVLGQPESARGTLRGEAPV